MEFSLLVSGLGSGSPSDEFRRCLRLTRLAEAHGFSTIVVSHHFVTHPRIYLQPIPLLSRLAAETGLRLATGILLLPLLNPVEVAESFATLDAMSGGRATLGVGMGYRQEEFDSFNVSLADRAHRLEEALRIITALWSDDAPVDFAGQFYSLQGVRSATVPVQKPMPPIWIAGQADGAVSRAGDLGHAWYVSPQAPLGLIQRQLALYRAAISRSGHVMPARLPIRRDVHVPFGPKTASAGSTDDTPVIVGPAEECAEQLATLEVTLDLPLEVVLRIDTVGGDVTEVEDAVRLLGDEVLPRARELSSSRRR